MKFVPIFAAFFICVSLCTHFSYVYAGQESSVKKENTKKTVYLEPSLPNFSQLHWRLGSLDINSNEDVDNFIKINFCDIYTEFFNNEFDWKDIRKSTREYLEKNKDNFDVRFEFVQPLKLGDYSLSRGEFEVQDNYKIEWIRRYEVLPNDPVPKVCGTLGYIPNYPRGLVLRLSRPFALTKFSVPSDIAQDYIARKQEEYRSIYPDRNVKEFLHDLRDAYIVMKVKVFASEDKILRDDSGVRYASVMAILEKVEIYADQDREHLLYKKNMIRRERDLSGSVKKITTSPEEGPNPKKLQRSQ